MSLKDKIKKDLTKIVVEVAEIIMKKEIDKRAHDKAIQELVTKI